MTAGRPRIAARAPNHLGDGVMALPALHALARIGELTVHAPDWGPTLYSEVAARIAPRGRMSGEVAVLFAPSLRAAWEARGIPRVIGTPTDARRLLLTDVVEETGHRRDTYARLARRAGAEPAGDPRWDVRGIPAELPDGFVAMAPVTGRTRAWPGFPALARELERPVVWFAGPGEDADLARIAPTGPRCVGQSLPDLAASLQRAAIWVGTDSGLSHVARAVGVPSVVVSTSTDPARTGPAGAHPVIGPSPPCWPCYRHTCARRLECLDVPVSAVRAQIERVLGEGR